MASKHPNPAHTAISEIEDRFRGQGRQVVVITQNIDGLHARAGSSSVLELHGNLFKTRCTKCGVVSVNTDSPICEALRCEISSQLFMRNMVFSFSFSCKI